MWAGVSSLLALVPMLGLLFDVMCAGAGGECTADPSKIAIDGREIDYNPKDNKHYTPYGEDVIVHCSSEDVNLIDIYENGKPVTLHITSINTTTLQLRKERPGLGNLKYSCVDGTSGCEDFVTVTVIPEISVTSPRIRESFIVKSWWKTQLFFIPVGEDYEVFCSGQDVASLNIKNVGRVGQPDVAVTSTIVNSTTIVHRARAALGPIIIYKCFGVFTSTDVDNSWSYKYDRLAIGVDYYPECQNFRCLIRDYSVVECSWHYAYGGLKYSLFYTDLDDKDKKEMTLCLDLPGSTINNICKFNIKQHGRYIVIDHNLSFTLMTCNSLICNKQTIRMNVNSLMKLRQIVAYIHSTNGVVGWAIPSLRLGVSVGSVRKEVQCRTCVYRVEYRLASFNGSWRKADTSTLRCDIHTCKLKLNLPYPDADYEVQVATRMPEATDDRVWSHPTALSFHLEPRAPCECNASTTTEHTVESMLCKVCRLIEHSIIENLNLKNKMKNFLKKKRDQAKEMSELFLASEKVAKKLKSFG